MPELSGIGLLIVAVLAALLLLGVAIEVVQMRRRRVSAAGQRRIRELVAVHDVSKAAVERAAEPPNPYAGATRDQDVRHPTAH